MSLPLSSLYPWFVIGLGVAIMLLSIGLGEYARIGAFKSIMRRRLQEFGSPQSQPSLRTRTGLFLDEQAQRNATTRRVLEMVSSADLMWSMADLLAIVIGLAFALGVLLQVVFQLPLLLNGILSGMGGGLLVFAFLSSRQNAYRRALQAQVPEIALLISNSLRANLSPTQAIEEVAKKLPDPAGREFRRVQNEIEIIKSVDQALQNLQTRHPSDELHLLITTLTTLRRAGGDMVQALATVSNAILAQRRLRAEIATVTAESRFTSIAVVILPIVVLAVINQASPGMVTRFISTGFGFLFMLVFYIVPQVLAFVLIRRIGNVKV